MERDGWVATDQGKDIRLTDKGCEGARSVIRRHNADRVDAGTYAESPWSRVHAEADQIEHTISEEIEARMRTNLDNPQLCPHGNPLPGYEHVAAGWIPLTSMLGGEKVIIRRIHENSGGEP